MKKIFSLTLALLSLIFIQAQITEGGTPISKKFLLTNNFASVVLEKVSDEWKANASLNSEKNGSVEKVAKNITTNFNLTNSGTWETLINGDRIWRLKITAQDALGVNPYFNNFYLPENAKLFIYNEDYSQILGAYTNKNNHTSFQFATEIIFGNTMIIEYFEPASQLGNGSFNIGRVGSFFKDVGIGIGVSDINESDACEININCSPIGDNWQDEKRGVARVLTTDASGSGWCTGSLVNNTQGDCKNYFLTALHCGDNSTTADFNNYIFYFNYEFSGCSNAATASYNSLTGSTFRAKSNVLASGSTTSDFLLVEINSSIPSNYNVYYNGWNVASAASNGGVGIHHPAGDVKKISTFNSTPSSVSIQWSTGGYSVISGSTHWSFSWSANSNGHGVTEGGSSGSPMFNNSGEIVGTLSGGGSYCNNLTGSDQYGKMAYHWTSNATANNRRLKPWLDPNNSGTTSLSGAYPPCTPTTSDDAGITAINSPTGNLCSSTFTPQVVLNNFGTTNLTSVSIKYQVNSGTISTYNWSGNLSTGTSTTINLNSSSAPSGNNTFTCYTQNPNGVTDSNSGNDSSVESFTINATQSLPLQEDLEGTTFPPSGFVIGNSDSDMTWEHATTIGFGTGTKSMFIDNWDYNAPGQFDWLVTPTYDFSAVTGASLTYDLAYAYYQQTGGSNASYDSLGIAASIDCGNSFFWLWKQGGTQLATAGGLGAEFIPTNSDWINKNLDLSSLDNEASVQFAFIGINGYGNNLYIDNINIDNAVTNVPVADFNANNTSLCPGSSVAFTDQSTNTPTSWSWSFAGATPSTSTQENPTVVYNNPGTYTVTLIVTNADGTDSETKLNHITVNSLPTLSFNNTNVTCYNGNNGSITAIPSGNGGFTYNWSGSTNTSATLSNLNAGTYTCTITDANMCTASNSTPITQPASALTVSTSITNAICGSNGSVIPSGAGGVGPYTYSFSNGGNGTNLTPGTYTFSVTDALNCSISSSFIIGNSTTGLSLNLSATDASCFNGNDGHITATASGSSGYTYVWTGSSNTTSVLNNISAGTYTCTVTDASQCSISSTTTVDQASELNLTVATTTAYCNNANGTAFASATGGTPPYSFTYSNGGNGTALTPGNYACTVTDGNNCIKIGNFVIINTVETFTVNVSTTNTSCTGNTGTASATGNGSLVGYTFAWDNGQTTSSASNLSFGIHTVVLTNANGCSESKDFNIGNSNGPIVNLETTDIDCFGFSTGLAEISISGGTPGYSVLWSSSNNSTNQENNLEAGNYTVTVTDAAQCADLTSFTINEPNQILVSFNTENEHCDSEDASIVASVNGGIPTYLYNWDNGSSGNVLINVGANTYTLTVTDQNNCTVQVSETIENIAGPSIISSEALNLSCFEANDGSISLEVNTLTGIKTINWSNGELTEDITSLSADSYTITLTDSANCSIDSTYIISQPDELLLLLNVVDNYPNPSTITANASGGSQIYTYSWSTGQNTQTISNLDAGTYTVTITDSENCEVDSTINIGTVAIDNTDWIEMIQLYPNPVKKELNLDIVLNSPEDISISIVNTLGQKLYTKNFGNINNKEITINTSTYARGIYYLQIETNSKVETLRFIKAK